MLGRLFLFPYALLLLAMASPLVSSAIKASESWGESVFRINDAKTRVSIASVKLSVSDLKREEGNLVGEYTIVVPLMTSKNDKGKIVLPLDRDMHVIGAEGGVLKGQAISYKDGTTPNLIVCQILPAEGQKILLDITTDDRTLHFKSSYSIIEL